MAVRGPVAVPPCAVGEVNAEETLKTELSGSESRPAVNGGSAPDRRSRCRNITLRIGLRGCPGALRSEGHGAWRERAETGQGPAPRLRFPVDEIPPGPRPRAPRLGTSRGADAAGK